MKAKVKTIIKKDLQSNFAKVGLTFDVIGEISEFGSFCIISPATGINLLCIKDGCAHLGGGDWEIIEDETKS